VPKRESALSGNVDGTERKFDGALLGTKFPIGVDFGHNWTNSQLDAGDFYPTKGFGSLSLLGVATLLGFRAQRRSLLRSGSHKEYRSIEVVLFRPTPPSCPCPCVVDLILRKRRSRFTGSIKASCTLGHFTTRHFRVTFEQCSLLLSCASLPSPLLLLDMCQ
jgi:hypothetical protein